MKALEKNRDSRRAKDPSVPPFDFKTEVRIFHSKCIVIIVSYGVNVSRNVYLKLIILFPITVEHTSGRWAVPQTRLKCKVGQPPRKVWCRLQVHKVRRRYVAFFCKLAYLFRLFQDTQSHLFCFYYYFHFLALQDTVDWFVENYDKDARIGKAKEAKA